MTELDLVQEGSVNLTERNWESTVSGHSGRILLVGRRVQTATGMPVASYQAANRPVISER